jgi:hypothetical protein
MKLATQFDTCFDETYAVGSDKQNALYRKGAANHWDADTRIDWSEDIDFDNPLGYDASGQAPRMQAVPSCAAATRPTPSLNSCTANKQPCWQRQG